MGGFQLFKSRIRLPNKSILRASAYVVDKQGMLQYGKGCWRVVGVPASRPLIPSPSSTGPQGSLRHWVLLSQSYRWAHPKTNLHLELIPFVNCFVIIYSFNSHRFNYICGVEGKKNKAIYSNQGFGVCMR